jgi:hypothetical protein
MYYGGGSLEEDFRFMGALDQTIWYIHMSTAIGDHHQWTGRQAFEPGEAFRFYASTGMDVTATGYQLLAA